ncbi:hypothetical protein PITCH_A1500023 [uncultured Desulfobacterium sp.]|uniref:Uncharacterized protein n=1 Tax=uncultured Desulfobacterium sp. TaxID=201089 RepID=A0A445MTH8_9BACT|nr:hypothetical protein PITCH_A1500023 [uncultured Desulfobacterium sp.]
MHVVAVTYNIPKFSLGLLISPINDQMVFYLRYL